MYWGYSCLWWASRVSTLQLLLTMRWDYFALICGRSRFDWNWAAELIDLFVLPINIDWRGGAKCLVKLKLLNEISSRVVGHRSSGWLVVFLNAMSCCTFETSCNVFLVEPSFEDGLSLGLAFERQWSQTLKRILSTIWAFLQEESFPNYKRQIHGTSLSLSLSHTHTPTFSLNLFSPSAAHSMSFSFTLSH